MIYLGVSGVEFFSHTVIWDDMMMMGRWTGYDTIHHISKLHKERDKWGLLLLSIFVWAFALVWSALEFTQWIILLSYNSPTFTFHYNIQHPAHEEWSQITIISRQASCSIMILDYGQWVCSSVQSAEWRFSFLSLFSKEIEFVSSLVPHIIYYILSYLHYVS